MAGSKWADQIFSPSPRARGGGLLNQIFGAEEEEQPGSLGSRLRSDDVGAPPTRLLSDLEEAPRSAGTGPATPDNINARLERGHWERVSGARATRTAAASAAAAERDAADDAGWAETIGKTLENVDDRFGRVIGGLAQSMPQIRATTMSVLPGGPLGADLANYMSRPIDEETRKVGSGIFERATNEIARNSPELSASPGKQFASDLFNVFTDLVLAVGASAATKNPDVGLAVLGTQVFGDKFGEMKQQGASDEKAFNIAGLYAAAELVGEKAVIRTLMHPGGKFGTRLLKGALGEGIQESITETLQVGIDTGLLHQDMTLPEAIERIGRAGVLGAAAGGGIGTVTGGIDALHRRRSGAVEGPTDADGGAGPLDIGIGADVAPAPSPAGFGASEPATPPVRRGGVSIELSQADEESPIPSELIAAGRGEVAAALGRIEGLPSAGERVVLDLGDGIPRLGTLTEITDRQGARGVRVELDSGATFDEMLDDMKDAGVTLRSVKEATQLPEDLPGPARPAPGPASNGGRPHVDLLPATSSAEPANRDLKGMFRTAESGTNDQAENERSHASGRYQFTKATWEGLGGDWSQRFDVDQQERMMDRLLDQNRAALKKAGVPATAVNMYLAHHFGPGGAITMMRNRGAPVAAGIVEDNPQFRGMNNGQALQWAADHVSGGAAAAIASSDIDAGTGEEVDTTSDFMPERLLSGERTAADIAPPGVLESSARPDLAASPVDVRRAAPVETPIVITRTKSDKGIAVSGLSSDQVTQIRAALPKGAGIIRNKAGETIFSTKYERQVRDIVDPDGSRGIKAAMPERQRDLRARPELGPTFDDPQSEIAEHAILRSALEGRRRAVETLTGPSNWLQREGYAVEGKNGRLDLTEKGQTRLEELAKSGVAGSGVSPSGLREPSEAPAANASRPALPDLDDAVTRAPQGRDVAITGAGREVPVRYAIVEADRLITSNTDEGRVNPAFPAELQPRDRGRSASQVQVVNMAANLDPRLLGASPKASDGAPIMDPSGVVLSGNGRTLAIRRAYAAGGEAAQAYRTFLEEQGADIAGMKQPVLVRVGGEGMGPTDLQAFTREANERDNLSFSASEQATSDATAMPADLLDLYRGGDIDQVGNRDFVRSFIGAVVPQNDQAEMIGRDGTLSQQAMVRIRGALLARAYENPQLLTAATESTDSNIKAIAGAMTDVAGVWAKMRAAAREGRIDSSMDATGFLNDAVAVVDRARREGRAVTDYVNQRDIFSGVTMPAETEAFLRLMFANRNFTKATGRARLADALRFYVEQAMLTTSSGGLFGREERAATPLTVAAAAKDRQDAGRTGTTQQGDLLAAANTVEGARAGERALGDIGPDRGGEDVPAPARAAPVEPAARRDAGDEAAAESLTRRVRQTPAERVAEPDDLLLRREAKIRAVHDQATPLEPDPDDPTLEDDVKKAAAIFRDIPADPPMDENGARLWGQARQAMAITPAEAATVLRDARAIAALAGSGEVRRVHIAEALSYIADWRERARIGRERLDKQGARPAPDLDRLKREAQEAQVSGRGDRRKKGKPDVTVRESQAEAAGRTAWEQDEPREVPSYYTDGPNGQKGREWLAAYDAAAAAYEKHINPLGRPDVVGGRSATDPAKLNEPSPAEPESRKAGKPESQISVSANTVFTEAAAERARAVLRERLGRVSSNPMLDPELATAGITLAGYHIEKGARTFAAYASAMLEDLGDAVKPYLRSWYESIRYHPAMAETAPGMSSPEEIGAALADLERAPARDIPPVEEQPSGAQRTLFEGDVRTSPRDAAGAASERHPERAPAGEERGGAPPVRPAERGPAKAAERSGPRPTGKAGDRGADTLDFDRIPEPVPEPAGRERRADSPAPGGIVATENWRIEPGALEETRPPAQKALDNLAAIEIVKDLDESGRPATLEQQAALARYVGWGGLKGAFDPSHKDYLPRLKELLTEEEYETARRSIQYAHYTPEAMVRPMWEAAARLGFKGGRVFEPGMGTGNFLGMMPGELAARTSYAGLEFDRITARIGQLLYPKAGIQHADYTKQAAPKDYFDLVIGNPPFSETVIRSDPLYAQNAFVLHDFFFAKAMDSLRPGGILMFVTSAGTMNKLGTDAREWLADRADLVGAVRLPGGAFAANAGTSVTADIVILRKRLPDEEAGDRTWTETVVRELPHRDGGNVEANVSRYFSEHPDMVLGEEGMFDKLIGGVGRYAVRAEKGADVGKALAAALDTLPADIMAEPNNSLNPDGTEWGGRERKDGSFYLSPEGKLMQQRGNVGVPVEGRGAGVKGGIPAKDQEKIRQLVPIRDALRDVYAADMRGDVGRANAARAELNLAYDKFTERHGPINKAEISFRRPTVVQQESARAAAREELRLAGGFFEEGSFDPSDLVGKRSTLAEIAAARKAARETAQALGREWDEGTFNPEEMPDIVIVKRPNIDAFMDDQEGYRLRAIEHYNDDTGEAKKGAVFFENVITKERAPKISSPNDALLYTLNRLGRPDVDEIANLTGLSRGQVLEQLGDVMFKVPGQGETYQTRELYLSGNVREKLAIARAEAERDATFRRNVAALEAAQPAALGPGDISANLGMPWIPADVIADFGKSLGLTNVTARYRSKLAQWGVDGDRRTAVAISEWGTTDRDAVTLLQDALNRQDPKVYKKVRDPATGKDRDVLDETATQAAQDKVAAIRKRFAAWVWDDTERADRLAGIYNRDFNNLVAPVYDGSYLTTPGIASTWSWRPHQTRAIARIVQSGNTYLAHAVGAGKTSEMIGAGMEMRRLGLVRKPMYAVPNHMLGQFTKEFYEQYPTANIMVADERQFHTDRRKQFVANMAAQDVDAVIITHSAFGYIPLSDEFMASLIRDQIADLRDILDEVKAEEGGSGRITQRRIEQQIEALQQKLEGRTGRRKDQVFTFEETGVDFLFVDEAHLFRKLDFATRMSNVRGIDPQGSQASFDLFAKTRYLEQRSPGRSHVLASGTPVTNTMAELYTLSRYLQPGALEERAIEQFDAWAGAFGETVTALEQDPAGGYKPQTRFARFVNIPELSAMVRQVMDVVTSKQLAEYVVRPKLKGGSRRMIVAKATPALEAYQKRLQARMKAIQQRTGPPQKGDDILLSVIGDGRKAAIDMRLIDAGLDRDEGSKLEHLIANVHDIWKRTANQPFFKAEANGYAAEPYRHGPATQLVFSDLGINGDFPVHSYIRNELVRRGVPRAQIAIISEAKTHIARQRLFNDVNEGKVRVMIGSVPKMGTGVNAQRSLYAIHNLDPQWYPANDEQRNGRGLRQGNENPEIEITDYSTKGTYDSTMWGLMETKARFIEGFFAGDPTMRTMDDLGEASQYEQAKAITTADPRILEMTGYKQDLERAMIRRAAFEREQYALRGRIADAEDRIEMLRARIPEIEQDIAQRVDIAGDAFTGQVGDTKFADRKEFGEAVLERMEELASMRVAGRDKPVGRLGGFKLTADVMKWEKNWEASLYINLNGGRQERIRASTPLGIPQSVASMLGTFEQGLAEARDAIARNEATIADLTPQTGKRFEGQPEIDELAEKVAKIEKVLTAEATANAEHRPVRQTKARAGEEDAAPVERDEALDEATIVRLNQEFDKVGLRGKVRFSPSLKPPFVHATSVGEYWPAWRGSKPRILVDISTEDPDFVLDHEMIHAVKDLGFINRGEWTTLEKRVAGNRRLMEYVKRNWPDLSPEAQLEEGIAEFYGAWQRSRRAGLVKQQRDAEWRDELRAGEGISYRLLEFEGFVRAAFHKLTSFLTSLYRGLRGTSAYNAIFEEMAEGKLTQREPSSAGEEERGAVRQAVMGSDAGVPDELTVSDLLVGAKKLTGKVGEAYDEWRTWAQDRMLPLYRTQVAAEKVLGRTLEESENPYLGEELMSGKVGSRLETLAEQHVNPLFEAMKAEKVTVDELESYLYARHAPERNEHIAEINPEFADGKGSGMSDVEARAIIARIRESGRLPAFEKVARYVDGILKLAMDVRVEAGLLSEETAAEWRSTYKHYVPLRGFAEVEGQFEEAQHPSSGGTGVTVRGAESKQAFGRRSMADDILAYSIMQAEEAILRGGKNEVARQFYELAKAAPDDNFWKINKVTMKRRMNPLTGLVESYPVTALTAEDKDWTVSLKIDGKARRVTMNRRNPAARRLAAAMRRLDEQQHGKIVQFFGSITRFLSAVNTSFNPEFVITNAFRDVQTAGVNMQGIELRGITRRTLRDYPKALKGAMKGAFGKEDGDWGRWYREFVDEGGRVYFNQVQDLGTLQRDIERRMKRMQAKNLSAGGLALHASGVFRAIGGFIGAVNNGVENAVRLAAYKNARELGLSPARAASLAKNLTVNFNRRGSGGTAMNAAYMFYNASIQGTARMLTAIKSRRVQKVLASAVLIGAALEALNMMTSAADDDDELFYDKISDFEKSRNLIIMLPGDPKGTYLKIPLPYGYNVFFSVGRSAVEIMRGKSPLDVLGHISTTIIDAFNPVGGTESFLNFIAPTVADPIVDLATNRDFAGRPIMPDPNPFEPPKPDNQRYWANVNPLWRELAAGLNKISGGDDVVPGFVDVSPESMEHLFGVATGAAGAFYNSVASLGAKGVSFAKGEDVELTRNDIPLVRKLVGEKPAWHDRAAFRARIQHVEQTIDYAKTYAEKKGPDEFLNYVGKNLDVVALEASVKQAEKHLREIRKERGKLEIAHDQGMAEAEFKAKSKLLDDLERRVQADFNATYLQTVKQPVGPK